MGRGFGETLIGWFHGWFVHWLSSRKIEGCVVGGYEGDSFGCLEDRHEVYEGDRDRLWRGLTDRIRCRNCRWMFGLEEGWLDGC